jgi:hypothetical protein
MVNTLALMVDAPSLRDRLFDPVPLAVQVMSTSFIVYAVLLFSLAIAYLALWWTARDYRVFRTMSIYLGLCGVQMIWLYEGGFKSNWALIAATGPVFVMIAGEALRIPNRRWTLIIWPFSYFVVVAVSDLIVLILIVQWFRVGQRRDRNIAAAFAFFLFIRATLSSNFRALTHGPVFFEIGGWLWALAPAAIILLGVATLVIYVHDLIEDRREKLRMSAEFEAARSVQQVLIPEEIPAVPGFRIQSVYKPAGEVGGDFFQILPLSGGPGNGGVLMIIGDVSGKGMPAAMTVSLLVGTVRTLVHYTQSPGEILGAMNQRMMSRSHGGFTTCLVLRAAADGKLTIANAGHIAPYLSGKELTLENGLPLGLSADTTYSESTFQLAPEDQLTLVTDGIVEARDKTGALFGFERTAALSVRPAEAIAQAAQSFGQDDDITALTLALVS